MRPIKFRAKKFDGDEWYYGGGLEVFDKVGLMVSKDSEGRPIMHEVNPATVGEFTGLLDRNGKEIWEGDIVRSSDCLEEDQGEYTVKWWSDCACFRLNKGQYWHCNLEEDEVTALHLEVIGNEFEKGGKE